MQALVDERVRMVWRECELQNIEGKGAYVTVPVPGGAGSLVVLPSEDGQPGRSQITDETCTWSVASVAFLQWLEQRAPASYEVLCKVRSEIERLVVGQLPPVSNKVLPWTL